MPQEELPFDALAKEKALRRESQSWDTSNVKPAGEGDIPVIDVSRYLLDESGAALETVADQLRTACKEVGFYSLTGHQVPAKVVQNAFYETRRFHQLPVEIKSKLRMDQDDWPIQGVGYLPLKNRKLPHRATGNENEAFLIKGDHQIALSDNRWPAEKTLPGFRAGIEKYASKMAQLAYKLLPIYARALGVPADFFTDAFQAPFYRLRMTHYPSSVSNTGDQFGIAPHVDTTFLTLLAQDSPGLCVFSEVRQAWIAVPMIDNAFIVNTGELLKQWSNDVFISAKHFANNHSSANSRDKSRYSIPYFYNANTEYKMHCIPSCCGPNRPARYPVFSYSESQGVVQGE